MAYKPVGRHIYQVIHQEAYIHQGSLPEGYILQGKASQRGIYTRIHLRAGYTRRGYPRCITGVYTRGVYQEGYPRCVTGVYIPGRLCWVYNGGCTREVMLGVQR